jgi:hypothetical protein
LGQFNGQNIAGGVQDRFLVLEQQNIYNKPFTINVLEVTKSLLFNQRYPAVGYKFVVLKNNIKRYFNMFF